MTNEQTSETATQETPKISQLPKPTALKPLALSASRANDFRQCPLLYRFRSIDRFPEPTTEAQFKGTVVHAVFERLFDLPLAERIPSAAIDLLPTIFRELHAKEDTSVIPQEEERRFLNDCAALIFNYYRVEDPCRFDPAGREKYVHVMLPAIHPYVGLLIGWILLPRVKYALWTIKRGRNLSLAMLDQLNSRCGFTV